MYISTPNGLHFEWASKALRAGKHVLCEKPFTSNAEEAHKLIQLAKETGLVCEEAVCHVLLCSSKLVLIELSCSFTGNFIPLHTFSGRFWIRVNMVVFCERMLS